MEGPQNEGVMCKSGVAMADPPVLYLTRLWVSLKLKSAVAYRESILGWGIAKMKILVIVASAQVGGNTDCLADAFLKGACEAGHETVKIHLGQTKIAPCLGCGVCTEKGACVQKDGMAVLAKEFLECDTVVFATPLYFWGVSAQMKAVIDRMYALGKPNRSGYFQYPRKCAALLVTAADSNNHFWTFEEVEHYYRRLVGYLHWTDLGILTAGNCGGTKEKRRIADTEHLERGYRFGKSIGEREVFDMP